MGIMLENSINMGKGPLHQHDSLDIPMDTGTTTTNINNINKRGKIFPPPLFHPDVDVELPPLPSSRYALCHECPTSIAAEDTLPFEQSSENERASSSPSPITTTQASSTVSASSSVPPPTADDFANLFFCESSEEEEARANLYPEPISAATTTNDISTSSSSTAPASHHHRPSATTTSTLTTTAKARARAKHKKKQRKKKPVSFGTFIPTIHLLHDTPPSHAMTHDERSTRWFSRGDLEMLKSSAQGSIQEMRARIRSRSSTSVSCNSASVSKNNSNTNNNDTNESSSSNNNSIVTDRSQFRTMMSQMEDESNSSIRGLEHRVFRRKHARKTLIRDVLQCQAHIVGLARFGHGMDGEERVKLLAGVSRERSGRAKGVAVLDARDDCKEVYGYGDEDGDDSGYGGGGEEGVGAQRVRKRQKKKNTRLVSI